MVSCMVDRICTARAIKGPGGGGGIIIDEESSSNSRNVKLKGPTREVAVTSETYGGSLVVLTPPPWVKSHPLVGLGVLAPRVSAHADYLCVRKLLMVYQQSE